MGPEAFGSPSAPGRSDSTVWVPTSPTGQPTDHLVRSAQAICRQDSRGADGARTVLELDVIGV
jgi:hypothetical protein